MSSLPPVHSSEVCLQVDDLLDAYALDALEPSERAFVDEHLAGCLQQRDRLAELEEALGMLALSAPAFAPPAGLWERLAADTADDPVAVAGSARAAAPEPTPTSPRPTPVDEFRGGYPTPVRRRNVVVIDRWVAWAGGVAAALLLASTVALATALQRDDDGEATEEDPLVAMVASGGEVVPLNTQAEQPEAIDAMGRGSIVTAPGLPPAVVVDRWTPSSEALRYIVWMAASAGTAPTVLGELVVDQDGNGILILTGVTSFEGFSIFGISIQTTPEAGLQNVLLGTPPAQTG